MTQIQTRILGWGARALYIGRAFELKAHTSGVSVLCAGLAGDMHATDAPALPASRWTRCRSVFVPAGTRHVVHFENSPIACLYLDPASADVSAVGEAMRARRGRLSFGHAREGELIGVFSAFATGKLRREALRGAIAEVLRLEQPPPPSDERVVRAIELIRQSPAEPHSLRLLARRVGMSDSRLRHAFKAATGVPVKRFRVWSRIGAAVRLAQQGADLTEAAMDAGFSSSAHFSNAFRAMFGMTPSSLIGAERESRQRARAPR